MNDAKKKKILGRLARIEGQVRGVCKLIEADEPDCEKIAQQMAAARKALDKTSHAILACMLEKEINDSPHASEQALVDLITKYA